MGTINRQPTPVPPRTPRTAVDRARQDRDEIIRIWQSAYPDNNPKENEGKRVKPQTGKLQ